MLKRLSVFAGALLLTGMLAQSASASLTIGFRLEQSPAGITATTISAGDLGVPITVYVYATVSGASTATTTTQWLGIAEWNMKTTKTGGGASTGEFYVVAGPNGNGNDGAFVQGTCFSGSGAGPGRIWDMNGDGISDNGTTSSLSTDDPDHPSGRLASWGTGVVLPNGLQTSGDTFLYTNSAGSTNKPVGGQTGTFYLGSFQYQPDGSLVTGATTITPDFTGVGPGNWVEDAGWTQKFGSGKYYWNPVGGTNYSTANGTLNVGSAVTISGPVPSRQ